MRPPHEGERARHDLIEGEGHLEDVVGAALVGAELQLRVAPTGEREDWCVTVRQPSPDDLDELVVLVKVDERQVRSPVRH